MRIYKYEETLPTEIFLVGNRICQRYLREYYIEPDTNEKCREVYSVIVGLAEKGIHIYVANFWSRKLHKINGEWMHACMHAPVTHFRKELRKRRRRP